MVVTLCGMVTLVKAVLFEKAEPPIATTGYTPRPSVAGIEIGPPAPMYLLLWRCHQTLYKYNHHLGLQRRMTTEP